MSKRNYNKDKKENKCKGKEEEVVVSKNINDSSYYYEDPVLAEQITKISFNEFLGTDFQVGDTVERIPGIMRIAVNPALPRGKGDGIRGLYQVALRNWTILSATNNKSTIYQRGDVIALEGAFQSLIMMVGWMSRFFGIYSIYSQRNRLYPRMITTACGIDADDFFDHIADYRAKFNTLIVAANKIPMPSNIKAFEKAAHMFEGIYLDNADSSMAQSYVIVPASVWQITDEYSILPAGTKTTGLQTTTVVPDNGTITFSAALSILRNMINAMMDSSVFNAVYSDILRLNEKNNLPLYTFGVIPENYEVQPMYNDEISLWINNMTMFGKPARINNDAWGNYQPRGNDAYVVPSTGNLEYNPYWAMLAPYELGESIIDFKSGNPGQEEIIAATRWNSYLRCTSEYTPASGSKVYLNRGVGDYAVINDYYVVNLTAYDGDGMMGSSTNTKVNQIDSVDQAKERVWLMTLLEKFDWGPRYYTLEEESNGTKRAIVTGDLNYFTTVDVNYQSKLADQSAIGLYVMR